VVAFVVMCSGITSASTASRFFAANFVFALDVGRGTAGVVVVAIVFMAVLAAVNLRGVGESLRLNVALCSVELTGLLLVIFVGLWAFVAGHDVDFTRVVAFDTAAGKTVFLAVSTATSLAFFAMTGFVYIVVAIVAVALVPIGELKATDTPLVEVVHAGPRGCRSRTSCRSSRWSPCPTPR
jgi:basic amino acid/polyamine antiporter, APA family